MATDEYPQGRTPSFNSRGQVRGFRSRPGAPMADPTQNIGAVGGTLPGFTSQSTWDRMFRNFVTGDTPSSLASQRNGGSPAPAAAAPPSDLMADEQFGGGQAAPPSLSTMAAGGPSHVDRWSAGSTQRFAGAGGARWSNTMGQYGQQRNVKSPFGWGSSFIPNA